MYDNMVLTYYQIPVIFVALFVGYVCIWLAISLAVKKFKERKNSSDVVFVVAKTYQHFCMYRDSKDVTVKCVYLDGNNQSSYIRVRGHTKPTIVVFGDSADFRYYDRIIGAAKTARATILHLQ